MILKAIFDITVFFLWRLPLAVIRIIAENMEYIYLCMYFGCGAYTVLHDKKELSNNYMFFGMLVIVVFFVYYIDKKQNNK